MYKILIIGANGFVGTHLAQESKKNHYLCYGADVTDFKNADEFDEVYKIDILEEKSIRKVLEEVEPNYIVNLAAVSSVKQSWDKPVVTFNVNVNGTINILESIRKLDLKCRVLLIGSSEQYGKIDYSKPVSEKCELKSINPYGISKLAQEKIALLYNEAYGLDIVLARAFNHIGPGQGKGFVVSDFASQLVDIEKGLKEPIMFVGNLSAERDFTDVRDVVKAYRLILEKGQSGEIYNVGSGKTISIQRILDMLIEGCKITVDVKVDKNKLRKIETSKIECNNKKLRNKTGWNQSFTIQRSLDDIMQYWRSN